MFLVCLYILLFQFLQLLINRLLRAFETLADSANSNVVNKNISIRESKAKLLLMTINKGVSKVPIVVRFNHHQSSICPLISHVEIQFMAYALIVKSLLLQFFRSPPL